MSLRLPTTLSPLHYSLTLCSDLTHLTFRAHCSVKLRVNEHGPIVCNVATPLSIEKCEVDGTDTEFVVEESKERITITGYKEKLVPGAEHTIDFTYSGVINSSMMGYYFSTSKVKDEKTGVEKTTKYALTQFEPTAARRALPCWDEPSLKATFGVSLITRVGTTALANTTALETKSVQDHPLITDKTSKWNITTFEDTPKMSTYLLAWANGEFEYLSSSVKSPISGKTIPLRIYATKEHIHQAQYALDVTATVLPIYEQLFQVAYPLSKLDTLVAADFDAGAMENWGLITGRTIIYLYDPKKSGIASKKRTASVQSHEIAHQWFGNIVTMEWWEQLWLNEAFATLMGEVISLHRAWPEWNVHSDFIATHLTRALTEDSRRSSHPIEVPCPDANRINEIFDGISYSKGASVLRMLAMTIGEEVFIKGVGIYLKRFLYSNASTNDLWDGIAEASGFDIKTFMLNWTSKIGFPVISVKKNKDSLELEQHRFLTTGDPKPEEDETIWHIPLNIKTFDNAGKPSTDRSRTLKTRKETVPLNAASSLFKLNAETTGVYRVMYDSATLIQIGKEISKFSLDDRIGLVSDATTLSRCGYSPTSAGLAFISEVAKHEDNYLVLGGIIGTLRDLKSVWFEEPEHVRNAIDQMCAKIFAPHVERLGYSFPDNESSEIAELRATVIGAAASAGHPQVVKELRDRFDKYIATTDESAIPGDIRGSVFATAVQHGGVAEFEACLKIFASPPTPQHTNSAMLALFSTKDDALLQRSAKFIFETAKDQDIAKCFASLASNPKGRRLVWSCFQANYDALLTRFAANFTLSSIIRAVIKDFASEKDASEVESFFKTKDTTKYSQNLRQGLESIHANAKWLNKDRKDVADYFAEIQ